MGPHPVENGHERLILPLPSSLDSAQPSPASAPPRQLPSDVGAVFWSFFGIRKARDATRAVTIKPHPSHRRRHLLAAVLVASLLILVRMITSRRLTRWRAVLRAVHNVDFHRTAICSRRATHTLAAVSACDFVQGRGSAREVGVAGDDVRTEPQVGAARIGDNAARRQGRAQRAACGVSTTTNAPRSAVPPRASHPARPAARPVALLRERIVAQPLRRRAPARAAGRRAPDSRSAPAASIRSTRRRRRRTPADRDARRRNGRAWRTSRCRACATAVEMAR